MAEADVSQPTAAAPAEGVRAPSAGRAPRQAVLQELARAWGVHRLYPGEPDREEFRTASQRVLEAVHAAAVADACRFEVRRAHFVDPDQHEDLTAAAPSLAAALYQHGIELLDLAAGTTADQLARLFAGLEADDGGLEAFVDGAGVLRLGRVHPEVSLRGAAATPGDAVWDLLADAPAQVAAMMAAAGGEPDGPDVLTWMRGLGAALEPEQRDSPEFVRRVREVVACLPEASRHAAHLAVLGAEDQHPFAARYVAAMPDAELAEQLIRLPDAEVDERVERYVASGRRGDGFAELVGWWRTAGGEATATDAGQPGPHDAGEGQALARTVARFLTLTSDVAGAGYALSRWKRELHASLATQDLQRVAALTAPIEAIRPALSAPVERLLDDAVATVLDLTDVVALLPEDPEADAVVARTLLEPLGGPAVTLLMGALAAERRRVGRSQLVGLISSLVAGQLDRLTPWLDDERWFVARNVMTIVERAPGAGCTALIDRALRHEEARVRLEATRALRALATDESVTRLRGLAADPDVRVRFGAVEALAASVRPSAVDALVDAAGSSATPRDTQERAIELLAAHPSPAAVAGVRALADGDQLPRRLRGHAADLLREREAER